MLMQDPHVVSVTYKVVAYEGVNYQNASDLVWGNDDFDITISKNSLVAKPKKHFDSVEMVRKVIEPLLLSWEIDAGLRSARQEISFVFDKAEIVDRNPSPGNVINAVSSFISLSSMEVNPTVSKGKYPEPPTFFEASKHVEILWKRYKNYLEGKENLSSMAYFCYTHIVHKVFSSPKEAATQLNFDKDVLHKLSELTSTKGSESTARKTAKGQNYVELTQVERLWIDLVIRNLIQRVGEYGHLHHSRKITMLDFPLLTT